MSTIGEKMQSITPKAIREDEMFLNCRKAFASSIDTETSAEWLSVSG